MRILAFGEVLWDVFPTDKKLGGAPMNFIAHLTRLGAEGYLLSSIGEDELGNAVLENMDTLALNKDFIKINPQKATGVCQVTLNEQHEPSYDLVLDRAYDNIAVSDEDIDKINGFNFDVLYFGSLAQRNSVSAKSLEKITEECDFGDVFCDINIRQSYYSKELIESCFQKSTIVKINRDECELIKEMGIVPADCKELTDVCRELCRAFDLKVVIVTLDSDGAAAYSYSEDKLYISERQPATPVSAVGAGDSFSACFLYNYLNGESIKTCLKRGNIMGAYVVGFEEPIPEYSAELLGKIK